MYTSLHSRHKLVTCESFDVNRGIFTGDKPMAVRHKFIFSETTTSLSGSDTEDGDELLMLLFGFSFHFYMLGIIFGQASHLFFFLLAPLGNVLLTSQWDANLSLVHGFSFRKGYNNVSAST